MKRMTIDFDITVGYEITEDELTIIKGNNPVATFAYDTHMETSEGHVFTGCEVIHTRKFADREEYQTYNTVTAVKTAGRIGDEYELSLS